MGDVYIFLIWNLISTLVEVLLYVIVILRFIPTISLGFGASLLEIRRLWRFSVSMGLLSILGIFIIQIDKLMLTNMMSLKDLGYYNLAIPQHLQFHLSFQLLALQIFLILLQYTVVEIYQSCLLCIVKLTLISWV